MMTRFVRHGATTTVLLFLCSLFTGCGLRAFTFELRPREVGYRDVSPLHVGVVVDKKFMPYKVKFRYWSSTNFTLPIEGLPEAFVRTLRPFFLSVEPMQVGRSS